MATQKREKKKGYEKYPPLPRPVPRITAPPAPVPQQSIPAITITFSPCMVLIKIMVPMKDALKNNFKEKNESQSWAYIILKFSIDDIAHCAKCTKQFCKLGKITTSYKIAKVSHTSTKLHIIQTNYYQKIPKSPLKHLHISRKKGENQRSREKKKKSSTLHALFPRLETL